MEKITIIVRTTLLDTSTPPFDYKEIKVCKDKTISEAKEMVLNDVKKDFCYDEEVNSLEGLSNKLVECGVFSKCDDKMFIWEDNCKGETYKFKEIDLDSDEYQSLV